MPNPGGYVKQGTDLTARAFGAAKHVVERAIGPALKAFRNIAHDGNSGAL
jgi:hypothetical protein